MKWTNKYALILLCSIVAYHTTHTHVQRTFNTHAEKKAYYKGRADEWHGKKQERSYPGNADEQKAYDLGRADKKEKMAARGEKPEPRTKKTRHHKEAKKAAVMKRTSPHNIRAGEFEELDEEVEMEREMATK